MPLRKIAVQSALGAAKEGLAQKLAKELQASREFGQPTVYEQEYSTKKLRVTVIWDEWVNETLEERSAVILKAYEMAGGLQGKEKVALASGLTVPEAAAAGLLPYQVIPARRETDEVEQGDIEAAMLELGASKLSKKDGIQLRFGTREEAEGCIKLLVGKLPASKPIWIISREIHVEDRLSLRDSADAELN